MVSIFCSDDDWKTCKEYCVTSGNFMLKLFVLCLVRLSVTYYDMYVALFAQPKHSFCALPSLKIKCI